EPREITRSKRIYERWAMTSSVIPSAKNSLSGCVLRLRNGRTATDGARASARAGAVNAAAKAPAEAKRSAGTHARALMIARSTAGDTAGRSRRTDGAGSVNRLVIVACAVAPR